jgi:hypothetical protein
MSEKLNLKQGTILPTTGIGTGYLLLIIYLLIVYGFGFPEYLKVYPSHILLIIWAFMQFSFKEIIVPMNSTGEYINKYKLLFFIPITKAKSFFDFKYFVLKKVNKTYRVQQGAAPGLSINEGSHRESYFALFGFDLKSMELVEICKGSVEQLNDIILSEIQPNKLTTYLGARKKGYEYIL